MANPQAENGWIKLHRRILADPKAQSLCSGKWRAFVSYILIACPVGKWRGYLTDYQGKPLSVRCRAKRIKLDAALICKYDHTLVGLGFLKRMDDGRLKITNYAQYQGKEGVDSTQHQSVDSTQQSVDCSQQSVEPTQHPEHEIERGKKYKKRRSTPSGTREYPPGDAKDSIRPYQLRFIAGVEKKYGKEPVRFAWGQSGHFLKLAIARDGGDMVNKVIDRYFELQRKRYCWSFFQNEYDTIAAEIEPAPKRRYVDQIDPDTKPLRSLDLLAKERDRELLSKFANLRPKRREEE